MKARIDVEKVPVANLWRWEIIVANIPTLIVCEYIGGHLTEESAREEAEKAAKMLGLEVVE